MMSRLTRLLSENRFNLRISTKMVLGYIVIVFLPFVLFGIFTYYQLYDKLITQYQLANQQSIEQITSNVDTSLLKVESVYSVFQNNPALISFLNDDYIEDRDLIYAFNKDISPAFSFAYLGDPMISEVMVYPRLQDRLATVTVFPPYEEIYERLSGEQLARLTPTRGLWVHQPSGPGGNELTLSYYHKLYNDRYTTELGILRVDLGPELLHELMQGLRNVHPDNDLLLTGTDGSLLLSRLQSDFTSNQVEQLLGHADRKEAHLIKMDGQSWMVNIAELERAGLRVVEVNRMGTLFHTLQSKELMAGAGLALLLLFSVLYYLVVSSLTNRVILLSRHMRRIGDDTVSGQYTGPTGTDEVGFLIRNYNAMLQRIDELVSRVQKVERLKKEADFKMLQAQIHPHFLYNTLETMRMLARKEKAHTVSEMAFSLGSLLRYSLSRKDEVTLAEELENAERYLAIHQIRLDGLEMTWEVEASLLVLKCPRLIVQPLVENSILHGLSKKKGAKQIVIRVYEQEQYVYVEVWDNGAGITAERLVEVNETLWGTRAPEAYRSTGSGIGLANVHERVAAFYGAGSGLTIKSSPGEGTCCTLKMAAEAISDVEIDARR